MINMSFIDATTSYETCHMFEDLQILSCICPPRSPGQGPLRARPQAAAADLHLTFPGLFELQAPNGTRRVDLPTLQRAAVYKALRKVQGFAQEATADLPAFLPSQQVWATPFSSPLSLSTRATPTSFAIRQDLPWKLPLSCRKMITATSSCLASFSLRCFAFLYSAKVLRPCPLEIDRA